MHSILRGAVALFAAELLLFAAQARSAAPPKFKSGQPDQILASALLAQPGDVMN
jgi:hypothetical protein